MRLDEYRADDERRTWLRKLLETAKMRELLAVLEENGPEHESIRAGITPHDAHIQYGVIRGYTLFADAMKLLSVPKEGEVNFESNYIPEE